MFCPQCKDEFRAGFTRCASCDVDLVDSLGEVEQSRATSGAAASPPSAVPMVEYCGFLDLDEARQARGMLRREGIRSDVLIRESPDTEPGGPIVEEYWLRVESCDFRRAAPILGYDGAESEGSSESSSACGECGSEVSSEEAFCPHCGKRFEEDR
jgi:hypothetical protein